MGKRLLQKGRWGSLIYKTCNYVTIFTIQIKTTGYVYNILLKPWHVSYALYTYTDRKKYFPENIMAINVMYDTKMSLGRVKEEKKALNSQNKIWIKWKIFHLKSPCLISSANLSSVICYAMYILNTQTPEVPVNVITLTPVMGCSLYVVMCSSLARNSGRGGCYNNVNIMIIIVKIPR